MKKLIMITAVFISLGTIAQAQEEKSTDNRNKVQIGAKIGGSYSNVYDAKGDEFNSDAKFGLTGGAFLMIPIGKNLGIQAEGLITQKGFKGSGRLLGNTYDFKRTTTFLDIPVFFAINPSEFITILAGPQFSYLLKQEDEFSNSANSYQQSQEFTQDNIRKNILGFVAGVDINLRSVVVSGRMGWDIQNNKGNGTSTTPRYKNVCAVITVGYKISFSNKDSKD